MSPVANQPSGINRVSLRPAVPFIRSALRAGFRTAIVLGSGRQSDITRKTDGLGTAPRDDGRFVLRITSSTGIFHHDFVIDFPVRFKPTLGGVRLAAEIQRPYYAPLKTPILWHDDFECKQVAARIKMRRLPAITTGIDAVVRSQRNIEFLLIIAIEVPEIHRERPVRVVPHPTRETERLVQVQVTEYEWEAYWVNRWNPFATPYIAYRLVPRTRAELRTETVTDDQTVSGKVRKEQFEVDDGKGHRS